MYKRDYLTNEIAIRIHLLSAKLWGEKRAINLIGEDKKFSESLQRMVNFSLLDNPVLITGESGVGKELFANSVYLLSKRNGLPFIRVNCAQYHDRNMVVSELFGHKKGSFTGAVSERSGLFKECNNGVIFLDEIGELSPEVQAMLLRVLEQGEIRPLGSNKVERVNVRIIAATNRNLQKMVEKGNFREDLYYRLCCFVLNVPPLRERGGDWRTLAGFYLKNLNTEYRTKKKFSRDSLQILSEYKWPGNIRELKNLVTMGFALCSSGDMIQPESFAHMLRQYRHSTSSQSQSTTHVPPNCIVECYFKMVKEGKSFWEVIQKPYLERELNREQVRTIVSLGLKETGGSYKKLLPLFSISPEHYLKFMDFLRHHRLKPENGAMSHENYRYTIERTDNGA